MKAASLVFAMLVSSSSVLAAGDGPPPPPQPALPSFGGALALPGVTLHPRAFDRNWRGYGAVTAAAPDDAATVRFRIKVDAKSAKTVFAGTASYAAAPEGAVRVDWRVVPDRAADLAETYVGGDVPLSRFGGGTAVVDGREVRIPAAKDAKAHLFRGAVSSLSLRDRDGAERLRVAFDGPTEILLQDGRHWGGSGLTLRLFFATGAVEAGREYAVRATFATPADGPLALAPAGTVHIEAGPDWSPLRYDPWIEPGSALDFSGVLPHHAPAGKFGRVVAVGDHFELEGRPGVPQRFYGVNLCFTANFPDTGEQADRFAANLARIGYNAVRIHHHERYLLAPDGALREGSDGTEPDPGQQEKFDLLVAACAKHGLYLTTDLYVSRASSVPWRAIGIDRDGGVPQDAFKVLVAFHEPAYNNLCAWTRNFLAHRNPHTGRTLAEEPALAMLALVNEGNLGNWGPQLLRDTPGVQEAWAAWLASKAGEPAFDGIPDTIPDSLSAEDGSTPAGRHAAAFAIFLAEREAALFERLRAFVRDECGCPAPLSSLSSWYNPVQYQLPRTRFDYVDDHFYVDHPQFLDVPWRLPSRCPNENPLAGPGRGARSVEFRRLMDRPFCITEFNYAAPGRFRGVGGIATGALAALQDWSGVWRFAWSHSRDGIAHPGGPIGYFDVAGDPLALAAERAALCLFLRGDVAPLAEARPVVLDEASLLDPRRGAPWSDYHDRLAEGWSARVGTRVVPARASDERQATSDEPPATPSLVTVDGESGAFSIDTPRTAGGFAESGTLSAGPLTFTLVPSGKSAASPPVSGATPRSGPSAPSQLSREAALSPRGALSGEAALVQPVAPATVWVSSLDDEPIASSRHLLLTHLTDVQNSGMEYADPGRTVLLKWGGLPHLMRRGAARIELRLGDGAVTVHRLASNGARLAEVPATFENGLLSFTARTDIDPDGATYLYEIVRGDD